METAGSYALRYPEDLSVQGGIELAYLVWWTNGWLSLLSGPEAIRHLQILFISK